MKTKLYLITNTAPVAAVEPGGVLAGVVISPDGDWPHGDSVQHVTKDAMKAMVSAWKNGGCKDILVDFDHDAEDGKSTVAAAWIGNLRVDESKRALVGDFKFTDQGAEAVANRRFRFLSPCWEVDVDRWTNGGDKPKDDKDTPAEVTPTRLVSVALTNKPNIPMAPLLNREPPGVKSVEHTQGNEMDPAKIKEALGLAPEATEEDILAALGKLKAENEECCREREAAKAAAAEKEAEDFAEANAKKCNREVLKAQYLANKEATIALVNAIPEPKAPAAPVCNRAEAKTPNFSNAAKNDADVLATYENMAPGKAKDNFLMANAISINRARNARDAAK